MKTKKERIKKIKSFLRMQSESASVTEIHEALSKRMSVEVSRKTIERDIVEMIDQKVLTVVSGVPAKYSLNKPLEVEVVLRVEEIHLILKLVGPSSELYVKLKKALA